MVKSCLSLGSTEQTRFLWAWVPCGPWQEGRDLPLCHSLVRRQNAKSWHQPYPRRFKLPSFTHSEKILNTKLHSLCPCGDGIWSFWLTHWGCSIPKIINRFSYMQEEIYLNQNIVAQLPSRKTWKKTSISLLGKMSMIDPENMTCEDRLKEVGLFLPGIRRMGREVKKKLKAQ